MGLTALIPWPYRLLAVALLAVALMGFGWVKGAGHVQAQWDAAEARQQAVVAGVKIRQAETTVTVVTKYVDRVQYVRTSAAAIEKEIPIYVPLDTPALPGGFRLLHDAAVRGEPADPARGLDAAPVAAQDLARTLAANYAACRETGEQLIALQEWVGQMRGADEVPE